MAGFGKKNTGGGLGNLGGLGGMMNNPMGLAKMVQDVQKKMMEDAEAMQTKLDASKFEGSAGGGSVKATVDGHGHVVALTISPAVLEDGDAEMLQDLVLTAVNQAIDAAEEVRTSEQEKLVPPQFKGLF